MSSISSLSSSSGMSYANRLFSKIDTDQSGGVSKEEFVNGRPSDVSESQAGTLYDALDSSGTGSLSESDFEAMENDHRGKNRIGSNLDDSTMQALMQGLGTTSSSTQSQSTSATDTGETDMISAMDTDGDGTISREEFLAARPSDVSEEMASNLWDSLDTENAGSLSTSELQTAMAAGRNEGPHGPPPPPPSDDDSTDSTTVADSSSSSTDPLQELLDQILAKLNSTSDTSETSSTSTASSSTSTDNSALVAFLEAVKSYDATAGYDATKNLLTSLSALA